MQELKVLSELILAGGGNALLIALLVWQVYYLQKKLVGALENNTRAMIEIKSAVDKCPKH